MLTIDEFRKLPDDEKAERYKELSDHDKFIWRISSPISGHVVKYTEMTSQNRLWLRKQHKEMLEHGKITKERYEELVKQYPLPEEIEE